MRSGKPSYTIFSQAKFRVKTGEAYLSNQRHVGLKPRGVVGLKGKESWF